MTSPLDGVRRNSFRLINKSTFLDVSLGRVLNVDRQRRHGADHIVTEFQTGTLILSEEETVDYVTHLLKLLPLHRQRYLLAEQQAADMMTYPMTQTGYDDENWELRHIQ